VKIACRTNDDCPEGLACVGGFCAASSGEGGGGGQSTGGGGGGAQATGGGAAKGGGATGGGAPGGGGGAGLDGGSDAGVDAGHDGGSDAGSDAGAARFCATAGPHTFCEDFDEPDADVSFSRWTGHSTNDAGRVVVDTSQWSSPPSSMRSYINPQSAGCLFAVADYNIDATNRRAKAEMTVRFGPNTEQVFGSLIINSGLTGACLGALWVSSGNFGVLEQALPQGMSATYSYSHFSTVPVPIGTWVRVGFDYNIDAGHLVVTIDGGVVIDEAFQHICPYPNPTDTTMRLGLGCVDNPSTLEEIWYDNVTFDLE
jgi:hypothetical protein